MSLDKSSRPTIPFTIFNNSGSSKPAYLYLFSNKTLEYLVDREGTVARFPASQPGGSYGLALEPGENRLKLPQLEAMRAYVSFGRKLQVGTDGNGRPITVDAGTPNDNPNYDIVWDFIELNWLATANGGVEKSRLHANVTQVDAFGLALRLQFNGYDPSAPTREKHFDMGFASDTARAEIFASLEAAEPWRRLVIKNQQGERVRALMPGFAIAYGDLYPVDLRFPETQLEPYIDACLSYYKDREHSLVLEYDGAEYRCVIDADQFTFIRGTDGQKYTMGVKNLKPPITRTGTGTEAVYRNAIQSHPNDGPGNRIAAVLGASLLRSTLMNDSRFPVPQADRGLYFRKDPVFLYAKAIHDRAIDNHAFCFGYDEVELDAGNGEVINPTSLTLTINAGA
jgi:hypothetical protein